MIRRADRTPAAMGWLLGYPWLISAPFFPADTLKIACGLLLFSRVPSREATRESDHYLNGNSFTT